MESTSNIATPGVRHLYQTIFTCNAALFLYEFLITIGDEIELVWSSKWGPATLLYYLSRYSIVPEICLEMIFVYGRIDTHACRTVAIYLDASISLGYSLGQGIIILRTWAIWNGSPYMKWSIVLVGLASFALDTYFCAVWAMDLKVVARSSSSPEGRGCDILSAYRRVSAAYVVFYCYEIGLMCLTVLKYRRDHTAQSASFRRAIPKLTVILYSDAFVFFVFVLGFAAANVMLSVLVPVEYRVPAFCAERIVYTSIMCRIILNLRAAAQAPVTVATLDN